ncbi:copper chaperone PCu(A)C [Lichenicola sp.]|uniref:copper chaperone PCu(A)C n=1 Tax=Lichenicola sp. TaxID=2804529 RepID=UPI003B00383D
MKVGSSLLAGLGLMLVLAASRASAAPAPICTASSLTAVAPALVLTDPWIRTILPSLPASGYFTLANQTDQDATLIGASSPGCGMLMLNRTERHGDNDAMVDVDAVTIPAHGSVSFAPGGYHLMCMDAAASMQPGSRILITLRFKDGQRLSQLFPVRDARGR